MNEKMKDVLHEALTYLENSGVIELSKYHSVDASLTKPTVFSWGNEQKIEFEFIVCGYKKGQVEDDSRAQCNGYGSSIEEAVSDLDLRFKKLSE